MSATTKIWTNGIAPTCEDDDLNGFKNENNNLIIGSGQSLLTADNQQTHKAIAHYAGVGDFYVDSGSADTYILSATGAQTAPPTYATGMRIRFRAGNDNTAASTVNVASLGVKNLVKDSTGAAVSVGDITGGVTEAYYDGTSFRVTSKPRFSKVRSILTAAQSIPNNAYTIIAFDTETFDVNSEFTTGVTGQFKPKAAGYYKISAGIQWSSLSYSSAWSFSMSINKNGTGVQTDSFNTGVNTVAQNRTVFIDDIVFLNGTTDFIDVSVTQNSGGSVNISGSAGGHLTNISIHRVPD